MMVEPTPDEQPMESGLQPAEVAEALGITQATLQSWAQHFAVYLELDGESSVTAGACLYTPDDLATLRQVKILLDQGHTHEQVIQHLRDGLKEATGPVEIPIAEETPTPETTDDQPEVGDQDTAEVSSPGEILPAETTPPAVQFLRDTLQAVAENQQILLNSQQASRDLMGVMIQDNLNLKHENTSLRDRMLNLERELAELRRRHADYRERMETRVRILEDAVSTLMAQQQAPPPKPAPAPRPRQRPPERRSFWARLIGG